MDDLIESFISSPTWSDANASIWSSSFGNTVPQSDFLLTDPEESNGENGGNSPRYMISSSRKLSDTYSEDFGSDELDGTSSLFINGDLRYDINKGLFPSETICQHKLHKEIMEPQVPYGETPQSSFTLQGAIACNLTSQSFGEVLNVPYSTVLPHSALAMSSSAESDDSKQSGFPSTSDAHSFSSASAIWNLSYLNASSLIGERKSQVFAFPGIESDGTLRAICSDNVNIQMDNSPSASDYNEFQKNHLPSFTSEGQVNLTSDRMRTHQQWPSESIERNTGKHHISHSSGTQSQFVLTNGNESNGTAKPRIRARRGQATDPHSIAERLRREKITERMKNLQELVPSSNKTDKASMLDEIIDYVKFLQLQVKVLSMSRLGATGAVVPLLTESQTEGSRNQLISSSSVVQGGVGLSHSQDNLAFEQEIVKLMESNLTTAMQHLQNKGLCLMPVALATAISKQKGSSSAAIPPERRKPDAEHCVSSQCSQSYMEKNISDDGAKKEEASKSINKVRELKTQGIKAN